jgi:DNA-binding XRE family transcriptional regulator
MAKPFKALLEKLPPERQARIKEKTEELIREMPLNELRAARHITQDQLAKVLGVKQSAVSRMEHRCDMYISTLQTAIKAMGGELEIVATFADGNRIRIDQFRHIERSGVRELRRKSG